MPTAPKLPPYHSVPPAQRSAALPHQAVLDHCGLTAADLDELRQYGDVLVPADGPAPRFRDADPDGEVLALALEQVGHRLTQVLRVLQETPGETPGQRLDALAAARPADFRTFRDLIVCSYLSTPAVWQLVGYDGRQQRLPEPGEAETYLAGGILDVVTARGPIYTATDPT